MINIIKMDGYRLIHSKMLYICLGMITMMAIALPMSGPTATLATMMGVVATANQGDAFMSTLIGPGVILILEGVALSLFIHTDFSTGSIKNIMTIHVKRQDYYFGKIGFFTLFYIFLMTVYILESVMSLTFLGSGIGLKGNLLTVSMIIIGKIILVVAFNFVISALMIFTRKAYVGIISSFLIATGGLSMLIENLATFFNWPWLHWIYRSTISGALNNLSLNINISTILYVIVVTFVWSISLFFLYNKIIARRDIV